MTQQVQDLIDELEGIQDKAKNEVDNLKYLLNIDSAKKETLENRVETLGNRVLDPEHEFAEET